MYLMIWCNLFIYKLFQWANIIGLLDLVHFFTARRTVTLPTTSPHLCIFRTVRCSTQTQIIRYATIFLQYIEHSIYTTVNSCYVHCTFYSTPHSPATGTAHPPRNPSYQAPKETVQNRTTLPWELHTSNDPVPNLFQSLLGIGFLHMQRSWLVPRYLQGVIRFFSESHHRACTS